MAPVTPGSNAGERYWEGERGGVTGVMTGGAGRSVREGGITGLGWFGGKLGRLAPGVGPVGLPASSFYFFLLPSFSLLF
jgi:hypothetical protein